MLYDFEQVFCLPASVLVVIPARQLVATLDGCMDITK